MNSFIMIKLEQAFRNFAASKLRSFLAVLGILVGTTSVVALVTCGKMATDKALSQLKSLGTDLISVRMYAMQNNQNGPMARKLSLKEVEQVPTKLDGVDAVAPFINVFSSEILYQGKKLEGSIVGVNEKTHDIFKMSLNQGRFISFLDSFEHYCVIGAKVYEQIKQSDADNVLGKQIWLGKQIYTIIGVLDKKTAHTFFPGDENRTLFIPIKSTALFSTKSNIDMMVLKLKPNQKIDKLRNQLQDYTNQYTKGLKVFITSPKQIIEKMESQSKIFTWLLALIGGISLVVGGIGVMNIMLVSVTERRREIGIRKAIGARPFDIQSMFLTESIVLTFLGGMIGVMIGLIVSLIISHFAHWVFRIYLSPIFAGFFVSVLTGIFFGFYPAYRAAKLDPIDALRMD